MYANSIDYSLGNQELDSFPTSNDAYETVLKFTQFIQSLLSLENIV